jgi:Protein of unknown function (DUF3761)
MRYHHLAAACLIAASTLALTGCGSGGTSGNGGGKALGLPAAVAATTAPSSTPTTDDGCTTASWPQAIPAGVVGQSADAVTGGDLKCYDVIAALAPDGHDVLTGTDAANWTVSRVSPAVGTSVGASAPVTLYVTDPLATTSPSPTPTPTPKPTTHRPAPRPTTPTYKPKPKPRPRPTATHHTEPPVNDHDGATALCNDGTLSYSAHHQGTCSHHHGVAVWYK